MAFTRNATSLFLQIPETMMKILFLALLFIGLLIVAWLLYRKYVLKVENIWRLPIRDLGFTHMPALPLSVSEALQTAVQLVEREKEFTQAKNGLSRIFTIQGQTANAYAFLYGAQAPNQRKQSLLNLKTRIEATRLVELRSSLTLQASLATRNPKLTDTGSPLTGLFLNTPDQFALSWTTYGDLFREASEHLLPQWTASLTDADAATAQFFPNISRHAAAFNLLVVRKASAAYQPPSGPPELSEKIDALKNDGRLFVIDLTMFGMLEPQEVNGFERFTPATCVWLEQDPANKQLTPFAVYVAGRQMQNARFYLRGDCTDSAWIYALQAAKVSLTVYGIWYGHVYHWHIVTAALAMTFFDNVPDDHDLYRFLAPQSTALIGFNDVLLLLWEQIAPPTSIKTAYEFLQMTDAFATGRQYFDDDPLNTLASLGLSAADFTQKTAWDQYPVVGLFLEIWDIVGEWVRNFVEHSYQNDQQVQNDRALQNWLAAAASPTDGNVQGLPPMAGKANLRLFLHSLVYRIVAHGVSRMANSANPAMSFVPNFPPCLQQSDIPDPAATLSTEQLLRYLPNTGTIGEMITFLFTFAYSAPYDSLIPVQGLATGLFFPEGDERNPALIAFREKMSRLIETYTLNFSIPGVRPPEAQIHQWPVNIET